MDLKELASVAGVSRPTVSRVAKKLYPDLIKKGVKTIFTQEQCYEIMRNTNRKHDVDLGEVQPVQNDDKVAQVDYKAIGEMIGAAVSAAMKPVVDEIREIRKTPSLPEPVKEDHYSLVAYCRVKGIEVNRSELALHGKELKKIANRQGIELKKIPDERWGFVNSYPVKILDEYFAA